MVANLYLLTRLIKELEKDQLDVTCNYVGDTIHLTATKSLSLGGYLVITTDVLNSEDIYLETVNEHELADVVMKTYSLNTENRDNLGKMLLYVKSIL